MCAVQLLRVSVHERIRTAAEDVLLRVKQGEAPALRALLTERLTRAAEEVLGLFEEAVAELGGRVERSQREIHRQRRLLDALLKPEVRLHRADVQQLSVVKEEFTAEQQEWSSGLDQGDPEPPHIKEEQEEPWSSQEGEQLQGLEADSKISFTSLPVKSEDDDDEEEEPQSSQLQQRKTEQMETEADGEECGGPEPDRYSDPDSHLETDTDDETDHSEDDWKETKGPRSGLNPRRDTEVPVPRVTHVTGEQLMTRQGEKPFSCSFCTKSFTQSGNLQRHVRIHTGEKPFNCSVCEKSFVQRGSLQRHMRIHTGEKPFSCSVCGKSFLSKEQLQPHMVTHSGEKPFSCSVCKKSFAWRGSLQTHMGSHAVEKRFSCGVCGQGFKWYYQLINHQLVCCLSVLTASSKGNREDRGGPEPASNSDPDSLLETDTDDETGV